MLHFINQEASLAWRGAHACLFYMPERAFKTWTLLAWLSLCATHSIDYPRPALQSTPIRPMSSYKLQLLLYNGFLQCLQIQNAASDIPPGSSCKSSPWGHDLWARTCCGLGNQEAPLHPISLLLLLALFAGCGPRYRLCCALQKSHCAPLLLLLVLHQLH
jgi:hypothetical protein